MAAEHGATTILIEDVALGMNLLQDLRANLPSGMTGPIGIKPEGSKVDRTAAQSAKIEAGHVHLPKNAPWLGDFLNELLSFPNGRYDDQVDSVSQFLRWFAERTFPRDPFFHTIRRIQAAGFSLRAAGLLSAVRIAGHQAGSLWPTESRRSRRYA
jgi:hypothetical protein